MVGTGSSEVFKKATTYREGSEAAVPYQPAIQHNGVLPCSLGDALSTLEARLGRYDRNLRHSSETSKPYIP